MSLDIGQRDRGLAGEQFDELELLATEVPSLAHPPYVEGADDITL